MTVHSAIPTREVSNDDSAIAIPLAALSRLNHHARVPYAPAKFAIYAYKTLAAHLLVLDHKISIRLVRWQGKCNRCTNGRFRHWDWDDGHTSPCCDCSGTGKRTLRFTETTLPDGQVWHHPWDGMTSPGRDLARAALDYRWDRSKDADVVGDGAAAEWHEPGEWSPSLPATKLETAELVPLLNEVEDWVEAITEHASTRTGDFWWKWRDAARYLRQQKHERVYGEPSHSYQIDLGRASGGCFVCGDESDLAGITYGRMTPTLHWSLPVCKRHASGPEKAAFPTDPPPAGLLTPDVRRWMDRHERVEVVA